MGSSVSVFDPESEEMVIISIFDVWSLLERKFSKFPSSSEFIFLNCAPGSNMVLKYCQISNNDCTLYINFKNPNYQYLHKYHQLSLKMIYIDFQKIILKIFSLLNKI